MLRRNCAPASSFTKLIWIFVAMLCVAPRLGAANAGRERQAIEKALNSRYKGRVLRLRSFQKGDFLRYTRTGALIQGLDEGTWTLYSLLEIKGISLKDDHLEIRGRRRAVLFSPEQNQFEQHRTAMDIRADIDYGDAGANLQQLKQVMQTIFVTPREKLSDFVPAYWKKFLDHGFTAVAPLDEPVDAEGRITAAAIPDVYKINGGVSAPRLLRKVDPDYTPEARQAKLEGRVVIGLIILKDGTPSHAELYEPLGLGLDEEAVDAVRQWKFSPATRNGEPVNVRAQVEVSFRLR